MMGAAGALATGWAAGGADTGCGGAALGRFGSPVRLPSDSRAKLALDSGGISAAGGIATGGGDTGTAGVFASAGVVTNERGGASTFFGARGAVTLLDSSGAGSCSA